MSTFPPIPSEPSPNRWYYADDQGESRGPILFEELKRLAAAGGVTPETLVTKEGETVWRKFAEVFPELFSSPSLPMGSPDIPIMEAQGDGGTLQLFPEKVCIRRKSGFVSYFT